MKIVNQAAEQKLIGGRGPAGIAAAATYIACMLLSERRTQSEIAKSTLVTEVTIRNRYKELIKKINFEIKL
jgi:transcription initiation factor TFIIB